MPEESKTANTQDLANQEYDGERRACVGAEQGVDPKKATPAVEKAPEVGLSQKDTD
jgi:hypothetical protein